MSTIVNILEVLGSLGVFVFGMKIMSEGIQKVAGGSLRRLLARMTRNVFNGLLTGTLITSVIQSSSATTVMVVAFVNAGLLTLVESIGVIMGANLGTTFTAWIVALFGFKFSLSNIALPIIGLSVPLLFFKSPKVRDTGEALIGFGLLFFGLHLLKNVVPDIQSNPEILSFVQQFTGLGFGSILIFLVVGILLTITVQSSSAAITITIALAYKGWIDFPSAAAIVMGENIGTTITAYLASLGTNVNAKRAARAHFLFNIIGVCWMLALFYPFIYMVDFLMPGLAMENPQVIPEHLALFHTLFNLCNILLLVGFVPKLASVVEKMVKASPEDEKREARLFYLSDRLTHLGELNLAEAQNEVVRMAKLTSSMFKGFLEVYNNPDKDMGDKVNEIKRQEEISDQMVFDITNYLVRCSTGQISDESTAQVAAMTRIVSELEDISDCNYRLSLLAVRKYRKHRVLSDKIEEEFQQYTGQVMEFIDYYIQFINRDITQADMEKASQMERAIDQTLTVLRKESVRRMRATGNINAEMLYVDILRHFEIIGNHAMNIFQALAHEE